MKQNIGVFAAAVGLLIVMFAPEPALAQKAGGILKMYSPDSPASMSFHVEALLRKLGASSRTEAVHKGLKQGLIEL